MLILEKQTLSFCFILISLSLDVIKFRLKSSSVSFHEPNFALITILNYRRLLISPLSHISYHVLCYGYKNRTQIRIVSNICGIQQLLNIKNNLVSVRAVFKEPGDVAEARLLCSL
jgi:hypothetical protein